LIHIIRKSTTRFTRFPSLVFIRLILTELQRFKNVKIYKEMYGHPDADTASGWPYISLLILTFLNRCSSVKISLINTKLGNLVTIGRGLCGQTLTNSSGQCKTQTADCRPGVKCRLRVKCRLQTRGKMQTADCRPRVKCRLRVK